MVPEVCHIPEHKDSTPLFEMPDGAVILHRDCYVTEIEREDYNSRKLCRLYYVEIPLSSFI